MRKSPPKLSVKNLSKSFGPKTVLGDVSFDLDQGQSLAVMGRSGTGKSVLFKSIVGLMRPDAGEVWIDGVQVNRTNAARDRKFLSQIAVVFQGSALFDSLPVWRNVMFAPMMNGPRQNRRDLKAKARDLLSQVGMGGDDLLKATGELSGGMQKRVAIARALAQRPSLIFFDEPTTGLDPVTAGTIDALIAQVRQSLGATTVTITHDIATAKIVADQALFLEQGKVLWHGPVGALKQASTASTASTALPPLIQQFLSDRAATRG